MGGRKDDHPAVAVAERLKAVSLYFIWLSGVLFGLSMGALVGHKVGRRAGFRERVAEECVE